MNQANESSFLNVDTQTLQLQNNSLCVYILKA